MSDNLGLDLRIVNDDLGVSGSGDLETTGNGRFTLLQDVKNLLDTMPGDLFGHPDAGAGVARLAGEEDVPEFDQLAVRAIADMLIYDEGVGPRIEQESIIVYPVTRARGERVARYQIAFRPMDADETNMMNLVWGFEFDPEAL